MMHNHKYQQLYHIFLRSYIDQEQTLTFHHFVEWLCYTFAEIQTKFYSLTKIAVLTREKIKIIFLQPDKKAFLTRDTFKITFLFLDKNALLKSYLNDCVFITNSNNQDPINHIHSLGYIFCHQSTRQRNFVDFINSCSMIFTLNPICRMSQTFFTQKDIFVFIMNYC